MVIGATNRPDALDPALRRAGRFDREISLGIPDENARQRILIKLTEKMKLKQNFDFKIIARKSSGYGHLFMIISFRLVSWVEFV